MTGAEDSGMRIGVLAEGFNLPNLEPDVNSSLSLEQAVRAFLICIVLGSALIAG